ncbi:MAG: hypothetical protein Tsb0020_10130 [Haliangiales bacterium]
MLKRLAEIVIDTQLASRELVLRAARAAERERVPLVAALVQREGVDELALVAVIRKQVRVPLADPGVVEADPEAIRELPRAVAHRLRVMPLSISPYELGTRVMQLAMADPTDTMAIAEVEHVTGCRVEGHLMPLSAIEELIENSYRSFVTEVMRREPRVASEPDAMADAAAEVPDQPLTAQDTHRTEVPRSALEAPGGAPQPSTVPFHRVVDEASFELRYRALLSLLIDKGVIVESEYEDRIRLLMKRHTDES